MTSAATRESWDLIRRDRERAALRRLVVDGVAERFLAGLEAARTATADHPGVGSWRAEAISGVPGLRSIVIGGFPHDEYYLVAEDAIRIVRVLHAARDDEGAMR